MLQRAVSPLSTSDEPDRRILRTTSKTEVSDAEPATNARNLQSDTEVNTFTPCALHLMTSPYTATNPLLVLPRKQYVAPPLPKHMVR